MSAGCCFGRGKQGECLGQVRVLTGWVGESGVMWLVRKKRGPSIAKMRAKDNVGVAL